MYKFDDRLKLVQGFKDCQKCIHLNTCKFHSKIKEVAGDSMMYSMTEYLEWNNILRVFELYSSCRYYTLEYVLPKGESINLKCDLEIITHIIYNAVEEIRTSILKDEYPEHIENKYFFFNPEVKIDISKDNFHLILKTTDNVIGHGTVVYENDIKISDILRLWFYGNVEQK